MRSDRAQKEVVRRWFIRRPNCRTGDPIFGADAEVHDLSMVIGHGVGVVASRPSAPAIPPQADRSFGKSSPVADYLTLRANLPFVLVYV
jgi:hypothetical protein